MADQIVITEKTSQAQDVRAAVGSRYGNILPAEGHLFDLLEPEDVVPAWKRWSPILLRPEGLYGTRPAEGGNKAAKLRAIREALRTATRVWLATDCDREGQLIGQEILEHYEYRGQVMRVLFTAQDSQTIRDAFGRAKPNVEYARLYAAAVARRQADQIYNLSLTRTATVILGQGARRVIGVGRVKTPTLAIVCKRELEIGNFVPLAYFEVVATARVAGGQFQMRHAPQDRIVKREIAEAVAHAARDFEGELTVRVEDKRQGPPKLHDLPSLQKLCSSRFGWPASKTLEVAQELYDGQGKKIITYPRAEVRYLPQSLMSDVPRIVAGLRVGQSFGAIPVPEPPVIRKGASGTFYDKGLEGASHHAVIPNVNTSDKLREVWPRLSSDEKKLFDVIARAYLAALMPDFRYRQTTAILDVRGFEFRASGRQPIDFGWRAAFPDWQPADEKGDEAQLLPALRNGEIAQLQDPKIEDKETRPPPRYNEGTLIEAMQNAWRFVDDEALRERLKEAKGIGTPATRAEIIGGLKKQGFLIAQGKHIVPTETGLSLFGVLKQADPALVDPGVTAQLECLLDDVVVGKQEMVGAIDAVCDVALRIIGKLKEGAAAGGLPSLGATAGNGAAAYPPTPAMKRFAESLVRQTGIKPPPGYKTSISICRKFLSEHASKKSDGETPGKLAPKPVSPAQLLYAKKIAQRKGLVIPDEAKASSAAMSAWIDANRDRKRRGRSRKSAYKPAGSTSRTDPVEGTAPSTELEKGAERYGALKLRRFALIDLEAAETNLAPAETGLRKLIVEAVISSHPDRLRLLWKSIIADVSERYLWAPPRVAPRQVSTKAAADNVVRRCTRLLSMVHELHKAGYQRIRISPGLSPSGGAWRCPITYASNIAEDGFSILSFDDGQGLVAPYSSADESGYFNWASSSELNSRELAVRFIKKFPIIAERGIGRDWLYAGWLTDLLGRAEQRRPFCAGRGVCRLARPP